MKMISAEMLTGVAILFSVAGALLALRVKSPMAAWRYGVVTSGMALLMGLATLVIHYDWLRIATTIEGRATPSPIGTWLKVDELNAPLIPMVALIHFLTALATARSKMRRFTVVWSLFSLAIRMAILSVTGSWPLIVLLVVCTVPPWLELNQRRESTRVYWTHQALYIALLIAGGVLTQWGQRLPGYLQLASGCTLSAVLIRCGTFPFHAWVVDWFQRASFGNGILFCTPLIGVYAIVRLVLPVAPDWMLTAFVFASLFTSLYAAVLATVQRSLRRFFAYWFLSIASLLLVGLELHTTSSICGSLSLWISAALTLVGLGLCLRAVESRVGEVDLAQYHGLYGKAPLLAVSYLLSGLGCVGFPGTLGFVATEMLVDGAVGTRLSIGVAVIFVSTLNSIALLRSYFRLFTGCRNRSQLATVLTRREWWSFMATCSLVVLGGIFPQPGIESRLRAAIQIVEQRELNGLSPVIDHPHHQAASREFIALGHRTAARRLGSKNEIDLSTWFFPNNHAD